MGDPVDLSPDQLAQFWGFDPSDYDDYRDGLEAAEAMLATDPAELSDLDRGRLVAARRWAATQKWVSG